MAVKLAHSPVITGIRHPNGDPQGRAETLDWLAARFTDYGWRPEELRPAEEMFLGSSPVADRMAARR